MFCNHMDKHKDLQSQMHVTASEKSFVYKTYKHAVRHLIASPLNITEA